MAWSTSVTALGRPAARLLFALSQTDGHVIWSTQLDTSMYAVFASPIIFNGMVYIGVATNGSETDTSLVGKVFALNATTGNLNWSFTTSIGTAGGAGVWGSVAYRCGPSIHSTSEPRTHTDRGQTRYTPIP